MPPTPLVNASVFPFEVNQLPVNEQAQLHVASSHWFGVWMNFDITSCAKYRSVWNHLGNKFFCTKYLEVFWQTFKPKSAQLQKYGTICAVNGTRVSFFFPSEHFDLSCWCADPTQDFEHFIQLQSEVGKLLNTISQNKRNRSCTCQSSIVSSIWPCVKRRLVAM